MTQHLDAEDFNSEAAPKAPFGRREWVGPLLGLLPAIAAAAAVLLTGREWLDRFEVPADYQWVRGIVAFVGLTIAFTTVAVIMEIRRWNVRRLVEDLDAMEAALDRDLSDFSHSTQHIREMAARDFKVAHD